MDAGRGQGYTLLDHFYCKFLARCRGNYCAGGNAAYGCYGSSDFYRPRKCYCCCLHITAHFFARWIPSALRYGGEHVDVRRSLRDELYYYVGVAIIGSLSTWAFRLTLCSC